MSRARRDVWRRFMDVAYETVHAYRRPVQFAIALPHGRYRFLRTLIEMPLTLVELAERTGSDAPTTTVVVTDLSSSAASSSERRIRRMGAASSSHSPRRDGLRRRRLERCWTSLAGI